MATITFIKRNKRTMVMMSSSSILRCISITIASSSYDNYYGRNSNSSSSSINDRFKKNNFICCCAATIRYASSNNSTTTIQQHNILYTSRQGDTAGHMVGSSIEKPIRKNNEHVIIKRFRHFKNQWLEETGHSWPSKCSTKGCSNEPNVGAHIFIHKREYAHLVPMCQQCNKTPMKNYIPDEMIDDHLRFPFHLDNGTACVELTHIHISKQTYIILDRSTWLEMLKRFFTYSKKHNSPLVPQKHKPDRELGQWVDVQRRRYRSNTIPQYQVELLEANGFVWDALEYQWDQNIILLARYKQREGHCNVPRNHKEEGANIGQWFNKQRVARNNGSLETIKEKRMEELGVIWEPLSYRWEEMYTYLATYKQREGHCNVPQDHKEEGANIGQWFNKQRQARNNGSLESIKEKRMEELGVIWEPLSDRWEEMYTLFATYKQREGHCDVLWNHEEDGKRLGRWVYIQHYNKRNGKLNEDRQHRLEEIGIIFLTIPGTEQ